MWLPGGGATAPAWGATAPASALCRLGCCSRQGSHVRVTVEKHALPTRRVPSSCGEGNLVARCFLQFLLLAPLSIFFSPEKSPLSPLSSQTSQPRRPCPPLLSLFLFFLSSLHFLFLSLSLLCIRFPESPGGFNFRNDYQERAREMMKTKVLWPFETRVLLSENTLFF